MNYSKRTLNYVKKNIFAFLAFFFMSVIMFVQADHEFGYTSAHEKNNTPIIGDGTGYYAYLPQYIVYPNQKNFSFSTKIKSKYPDKNFFSLLSPYSATGKMYDKFFIGTAVLQSPFYSMAHLVHVIAGWNGDGYNLGYRFSITISALFYWFLGVLLLYQLFLKRGFKPTSILIAICCISFGTNLNHYVVYSASMSHVYSFFLIALFLYLSDSWSRKKNFKLLVLIAFVTGLIVITRPINGLILISVPFFFIRISEFWVVFKNQFFSWKKGLVISFAFAIPLILQLLVNLDQTDQAFMYSYNKEGFSNILNPQIWNVLFSFKKGFFTYGPLLFLIFPGLYFFYKRENKLFFIGWSLTVLTIIYMVSSWWCWDYGGGLGMRALIEFLPLFLFPIIYLFDSIGKWAFACCILFGCLSIYVFQVFQIQINHKIIHHSDMNKKYFWDVFMHTEDRFRFHVDFDQIREHLPKIKYTTRAQYAFQNLTWIKKKTELQDTIISSGSLLVIYPEKSLWYFKGRFRGKMKMNDDKNVPFLFIGYYSNDELIEETVLTLGSIVESPWEYSRFSLDINHALTHKGIDRILIEVRNGGAAFQFKETSLQLYD